jgi:hypothetical protein
MDGRESLINHDALIRGIITVDHVFYERAVDLLVAELGDELVALEEKGGNCFGFNGVATSVWQMLNVPRSFETIHSTLLSEYEVDPEQCASELRVLLEELTGLGLVRSVPDVAAIDRH